MRTRFILSETWMSLRQNLSMIFSVMLVTFISFLFIGASVLMQAQVTRAKGDWYDKVEVVAWLCPDGTSQAASCASGKAPTQSEIVQLQNVIHQELGGVVAKTTYVSRAEFFKNTFLKQYPDGVY
ncbi:MAG: ABC transporter permease, partial [Bifidobacterium mongoliense]|nr:ABC transporter permease [Bifidobacterium mongoliense]